MYYISKVDLASKTAAIMDTTDGVEEWYTCGDIYNIRMSSVMVYGAAVVGADIDSIECFVVQPEKADNIRLTRHLHAIFSGDRRLNTMKLASYLAMLPAVRIDLTYILRSEESKAEYAISMQKKQGEDVWWITAVDNPNIDGRKMNSYEAAAGVLYKYYRKGSTLNLKTLAF